MKILASTIFMLTCSIAGAQIIINPRTPTKDDIPQQVIKAPPSASPRKYIGSVKIGPITCAEIVANANGDNSTTVWVLLYEIYRLRGLCPAFDTDS